ncbi:hypothetical protein SAMN04489761_0507 [Tenacibaculum sp. MAR_2009_124]|uniref:hypothetical protein n=1 Tax=Tenacibaculum sp. MAR_2009_124 TaxID=1250059 RepID=UPI00089436CC|nr:hypothetical protein [Tenacibaculum sp. MAR_2009_124]SEB40592.1 hypothetical protein SAMN04489761_0507 [Tenacibaculum sp. MAR_2009_124]
MEAKKQENIEKYIHNKMSGEERSTFENEMKLDSELKEDVILQLNMHRILSNNKDFHKDSIFNLNEEKNAIKDLLKSEELSKTSDYIRKNTSTYKNRKKRFNFYKYAASIAAMILLSFFVKNSVLSDNTDFYREYADWNNLPSLVEKGTNENWLNTIEVLYKNKEYETIVKLDNEHSNDAYFLIYKGVAYAQLNDINNANRVFDLLVNNDSLESTRGYWYKLLLLLKENKKEEAKKLLILILKDKNNYNYNKAKEIHTKME